MGLIVLVTCSGSMRCSNIPFSPFPCSLALYESYTFLSSIVGNRQLRANMRQRMDADTETRGT